MKLSIIVPVFNMALGNKLVYCLDSLVHQELEDYEIIAVDDASTDNSLEILREYEKNYPQIKVIASSSNKKQGGAKNLGLEKAVGDWIGFIDSDDWIDPKMYQKLLKKAEETGADIVGCDYALTQEQSMKPGQRVANNYEAQTGVLEKEKYKLLILDSGSLVVKIYRRHIIYDYNTRFPEGIFYEDNAIANSWLLRGKRFEYIPEPLYYYYQHDTSTVHTVTKVRCEHRMEAARIMIREARKEGYYDCYKAELEYSFTVLFYVNTLFSYLQGTQKKSYQFVRALCNEMQEFFPDFMSNPYFIDRMPKEEKAWISLQLRKPRFFYVYYLLKLKYRRVRKNMSRTK